jgi:glycerol-3-phosphate cytidylyltransferase-like family protein
MDTRRKILSPGEALPAGAAPVALVTGYFDILRAEHARQLAAVRRTTGAKTLIVLVLPLEGELMEQAERARMTAALRVVDYVITAEIGDVDRLIERFQPAAVVRLEEADARQRRQLMEHVQRRQT